jgi:hypothetical protein
MIDISGLKRKGLPIPAIMDNLSLSWRGMAGVGKKTKLYDALRKVAASRQIHFSLQYRGLDPGGTTGDIVEAGATDGGAGPEDAAAGQITMEISLVHMGLDIARMSMQDKHILRPILTKLGQGSQVLTGQQGRCARILVLYHAHLLSSESVLFLQACLEQNEGDLSIWLTSEMPVPQRIRDWFIEIPVGGHDRNFAAYITATESPTPLVNWPDIFRALFDRWRLSPPPKLQEVKEVKAFVYEMLMRNLRWVEAVHFILDVLLTHTEITEQQRKEAINALATCEATGGGYTIPSYRIPILWESLFLQLRSIFCLKEAVIVDAPARPGRASIKRKRGLGDATTIVGAM